MATMRSVSSTSKIGKASRGVGGVGEIPIAIRSTIPLRPSFEGRVRRQLARRVVHGADVIERGTVRFDDVNGPRGGRDTVCRIKLVMSGLPSLVVEKRAVSPGRAFAPAVEAIGTKFRRRKGKHRLRSRSRRGVRGAPAAQLRNAKHEPGELIGRRVGRGHEALARALERPEKGDRAAYVDTAAPGVSASDRRAGGGHTARRNTLARTSRAHSTLEDSRKRPSRKSTRRSANRGKPSGRLERAAAAAITTPQARANRGRQTR